MTQLESVLLGILGLPGFTIFPFYFMSPFPPEKGYQIVNLRLCKTVRLQCYNSKHEMSLRRLKINLRLWDAKSHENETLRPITNAAEISRSGQNFLRPTFLKEPFYTPLILLIWFLKALKTLLNLVKFCFEMTWFISLLTADWLLDSWYWTLRSLWKDSISRLLQWYCFGSSLCIDHCRQHHVRPGIHWMYWRFEGKYPPTEICMLSCFDISTCST